MTAPTTTPTRTAALRGSTGFLRGRGRPDMVTMRTTTYLAGIIEGQALAQEGIAVAERMQTLAAIGSRQLLAAEAGRFGVRSTAALAELRRLAGALDE